MIVIKDFFNNQVRKIFLQKKTLKGFSFNLFTFYPFFIKKY